MKDEVYGTSSDNLLVTLSDGENEIIVNPFADNTFILKDFSSSDKVNPSDTKTYLPKVETTLTLRIQNNSKTSAIKLFSIFPGNYNERVKINTQSKFDPKDYINGNIIDSDSGSSSGSGSGSVGAFGAELVNSEPTTGDGLCVPIYRDDNPENTPFEVQHMNQWMYFRIADAYNYSKYYKIEKNQGSSTYTDYKIVGYHTNYNINSAIAKIIYPGFFNKNWDGGMCVFPHITSQKDICITETDSINYKIIYPGESLEIPISVM